MERLFLFEMILNGGLYKNENELRLSMSRIKEYKEWKKITEYELSACKIELTINIDNNVNPELIKSKLIEYYKQCEINKASKDTLSRIKIKLIKDLDYINFNNVLQSYR